MVSKKRALGIPERLVCKLCGRSVTHLSQHLRGVHKMSGKQYKQKFPLERLIGRQIIEHQQARKGSGDVARVVCRECGAKLRMITSTHLGFHGMTQAAYRAKYPKASMKTKTVGKVQSEKALAKVLAQHKDPSFKEKLRRGITKVRHLAWARNEELCASPKYRRWLSKIHTARWKTMPESERIAHFEKSNPFKYLYRSRSGRAVWLRSRLEVVVAYCLDVLGEDWKYETVKLRYLEGDFPRHFVPDFVLPGCYVEAKEHYIISRNPRRWRYQLKAADKPVFVVTTDVLRTIGAMSIYQWTNRNCPKHGCLTYSQIRKKWGERKIHLLKKSVPESPAR